MDTEILAISDVNNDGWIDVFTGTSNGGLFINLNDQTGGFNTTFTEISTDAIYSIEFADLNKDGYLDLFTNGATSPAYYLNDKNGTFTSIELIDANLLDPFDLPLNGPVVPADLDGDGFFDVISASRLNTTNAKIAQFINTGDGLYFTSTDSLSATYTNASIIKALDFDLDGDLDILAAQNDVNQPPNTSNSQSLLLFENTSFIIYQV